MSKIKNLSKEECEYEKILRAKLCEIASKFHILKENGYINSIQPWEK